jgi:hypothetical protein
MALDPRIPLGVQPVQQPQNMLAQYGQIMGIRAAQQEMQGSEEMRNLFASGANFDDPEFQRRGYMANPRQFQELLGKRATTRKTDLEGIGKEIELRRDALANVNTPEDYLKWHDANHQGKLGEFFKSAGINPSRESIVAQLSRPGGLDVLKRNSALGATTLAKELMQTERTRISSGPGYMNAQLARERFNLEQQQQAALQNALNPSAGPAVAPAAGPAVAPAVAPAAGPVNALAPQAAPASNVNALAGGDAQQRLAQIDARIEQLVSLGTPDALRAADVLFRQRNAISPSTGAVPGSIQEFNLAKQQGYAGTFMDFKKDKAALNSFGQPIEVARTLPDGSTVVEMVYPNPVQGTMTPLSNLTTPAAPPTAAADASGSAAPVQKPATVAKITVNNSELNRVTTAIDQTIATINNIIGDPSKKTGPAPGLSSATGPIMSRLPTTRTETANVEADMLSLESKASILGLRDIRKDAAVGSITEKEWPRFEGYLAALARSQGTPQYIERAKEFRTYLEGIKKQAVESTTKANKALGAGGGGGGGATSAPADPLGIR